MLAKRYSLALLGLSFAGEVASLYLTYAHHRLHVQPGWRSVCDVNLTVSCDSVLVSPYAVVAGMPVAAIAVWLYAVTGTLAISALTAKRLRFPRSPAALLVLVGMVAVAVSLVFAALSAFILHSLCPLCAGLYLINVTMLAVAWQALRSTRESLALALDAERAHLKRHAKVGLAWAGASILLFLLVLLPTAIEPRSASPICAALSRSQLGGLRLVVYSDFQCPACKDLDASLRPISSRLRLEHRQFPLDATCNPQVKKTRHPGACLQSRAAICGAEQSRYGELSNRLFDDGTADRARLVDLAGSIGLDQKRFQSCLSAETTGRQLVVDLDDAAAQEVRATPTLFVNGHRHVGRLSEADLKCLNHAVESR